MGGVSAERLRRFFVSRDRVYQINRRSAAPVSSRKQDLTKDPPFSKIDLISCCNLLIYLGPVLQKRAISLFHYALKPGGFLVLGSFGIDGHVFGFVSDGGPQATNLFEEAKRGSSSWEELPGGSGGLGLTRAAGARVGENAESTEKHAEVCGSDAAGRILAGGRDR